MEFYNWQINMKNGDKFIVRNNCQNPNEFLEQLLGHGKTGIVVSHMEKVGSCNNLLEGTNAVAIINTDISSVEYITKWEYK